ncbi:unnamed protein product, partial [Prorocentrum cordatum]
ALAAALGDRLGKALMLHHTADVALACHMHRLGDALRAVAKTLDVDMDFVHWGMEIKGDGEKARHEPLVAFGIQLGVCVAEPALELSGQRRWLGVRRAPGLRRDAVPCRPPSSWTPPRSGAQPCVSGWARTDVLLAELGSSSQGAETTAHADDRADGVVEDAFADDAKLNGLGPEALGSELDGVAEHVDKTLQNELVLDHRMMRHILEVEAQLRSWEALYKVFETGMFARARSMLDRFGFEPHGGPAVGGAPPARTLVESPPDSAIPRTGTGVA